MHLKTVQVIKGNVMKCLACDEILTDQEATRKNSVGGFVDICFNCFPMSLSNEEDEEINRFLEEEDIELPEEE